MYRRQVSPRAQNNRDDSRQARIWPPSGLPNGRVLPSGAETANKIRGGRGARSEQPVWGAASSLAGH